MSPFMLIKADTASCFRISIEYTPEHIHYLQLKDKNKDCIKNWDCMQTDQMIKIKIKQSVHRISIHLI